MTAFGSPLTFATLTGVVEKMETPNTFIKDFLFPARVALPTETIELSQVSKDREMAPFVMRGAEGIMVPGWSESFQSVSGPNIRIKRPLNPSESAFRVYPGTHKYTNNGRAAIARARSMNLRLLEDYITNAEEWLCATALQGVISYAVAGQDVFTITFPKPSAHNITLSTFWNDATPANVNFVENCHTVKKLASDAGITITDCILGSEAATALRALINGGHIKMLDRDATNRVAIGDATFVSKYDGRGVIYIGTLCGFRFWEYSRTVIQNGSSVNLIRPKYAEFVGNDATAAGRVLYYAAIPDMDAQGGLHIGTRFAKEWKIPDPSALMQLNHSRPLPVLRDPEATISMKVVSG